MVEAGKNSGISEDHKRIISSRYAHLFGGRDHLLQILGGELRTPKQRFSQQMEARWRTPGWRAFMKTVRAAQVWSEATKTDIRETQKKRYSHQEARDAISLAKGGSRLRAYPWLSRGAATGEVMDIEGMTRSQVENVRSKLRRQGLLKKPTAEDTKIAKQKGQKTKEDSSRQLTDDQLKSNEMARKLSEAKLIPENLQVWRQLTAMERQFGLQLPVLFADRVRFEVCFFIIRNRLTRPEAEREYTQVGNSVDSEWFRSVQIQDRQLLEEVIQVIRTHKEQQAMSAEPLEDQARTQGF